MKNLYNKLNKFNVNMELVDDIYYKNNFIDGIVIYFPNGETFQVFKDEDNKYRFINENLAVVLISDDVNETIKQILIYVENKNREITKDTRQGEYIIFSEVIKLISFLF